MGGTLTVSERILFHLSNYVKYEDRFEVPFDVTQDGISQAISISRAHAAIELKKLKRAGTIEERLSHIKKGKARRKAYSLTVSGRTQASTVVQYVKENAIDPMVDPSRIAPVTNAVTRPRSSKKSSPLPTTRTFIGRERELAALRKAFDAPSVKVVSVKGIAGIGKTSLASKLAAGLTDQRVFWYATKPWDVPRTVTEALARFFFDNGCRKMCSYIESERVELGDLSVLLKEELSENGYTFVFDDADCAPGLQEFMRMFRDSSGAAKMVVTVESVPGFYERSDVVARNEVFELELGGLDKESALKMLESRGIRGESAGKIVSMTKGHPLSLEMVTASGLSEARIQVARFLEDEFYTGLSESEKSLLQLASVFNKPFPAEAIPRDLRGDRKGSMLREVARGRFEIHSSLRDFVYESMSADERSRWHSAAADHYLRVGDHQERLYHLVKGNRSLEAEMLIGRMGGSLLDMGDVQRLWGVLRDYTPKKERYAQDVRLLKARAANMVGDYASAQSLLESLSEDSEPRVRAEALTEMGELRGNRGDLEGASRLFSSALENCPGAPGLRAKALRGLGVVENRMGDHRKAQELLEESARDAMAAVDSRGMLLAHLELGKVLMGRGMYEEAISHFSKCAAGFGPVDLAKVYVDMGAACAHIGRLDEAKLHLENAVKLSSETGQPRTRAYAHASLAEVLSGSGDYESARECCFAALEVFTELGDKAGASAAYASLGAIDRLRGDIAGSEEHRRESLAVLDGAEVPPVVQK
ncbi:MAG: Tetratricopeptide repeat protein [Candidatus Thermoplasmatota archaeon]|nr:Tetratricopeptide repeat protein [Candidatus Thermoplasmatota archaeon]